MEKEHEFRGQFGRKARGQAKAGDLLLKIYQGGILALGFLTMLFFLLFVLRFCFAIAPWN